MINSISCIGFRGFSTKQTLDLAIPNGKRGSGLTVLVGPNGGGKSTLVECFNKVSLANKNASFSKGKRNHAAGNRVIIEIAIGDNIYSLRTIRNGSETEWNGETVPKIYYLPSRRFFNPYFGMSRWDRQVYLDNPSSFQTRTNSLDSYTRRLIDLNKSGSDEFDGVIERILNKPLNWTIDQEDNGDYFVNITKQLDLHHNSDGLGEGIVSLMFIVDALCGKDDELIVIDEPELSLHPQLQMRLMNEFLEKSKNSQVVIATHSTNMLSLESIVNGGMVARVFESDKGTKVCILDEESRNFIESSSHNLNNPHILGTDARACFFAEDNLIITEGQEDVVLYPIIMRSLGKTYSLPFFGYGAGGASSIRNVAHLLHVLGFEKVCAIYDGDKKDEYDKFNEEYHSLGYKAWIIPADDIRDKESNTTIEKCGLLKSDRKTLKQEYNSQLSNMFDEIFDFLH